MPAQGFTFFSLLRAFYLLNVSRPFRFIHSYSQQFLWMDFYILRALRTRKFVQYYKPARIYL